MRQDLHAICEECDEAITNPICPDCLERQVIAWLGEIGGKEGLILKVKDRMELVKKQSKENDSNVSCILCGKKLGICPHCASKELLRIFQKEKRLLERFLTLFSYVY